MTRRTALHQFQMSIIPLVLLCPLFCSPYRQYVRVDASLPKVKSAIDTIAVFSDAVAAIDAKKPFLSARSSYLLDSLINTGVQKSLSFKGYWTRTIDPLFMGSFMDTCEFVPVQKAGETSIDGVRFPYLYRDDLSANQIDAFRKTCRRLYLLSIYGKGEHISLQRSNPLVQGDLDTLRTMVGCDHMLLIFHQAVLVDPEVTGGMIVGSIVASAILSGALGGIVAGGVIKESIFHTYMVLVRLSTGDILWSNYSSREAAPLEPVFLVGQHNNRPISTFMNPDTLNKRVVYQWHKKNILAFPRKNGREMFLGYKKNYEYPVWDLFERKPPYFSDLSNLALRGKIDSAIAALSLAENAVPELPRDSIPSVFGKGRSAEKVKPVVDAAMRYFLYAYYSRLRFKHDLKGEATMEFVITTEGKARNVRYENSTLNDPVFEYEMARIIGGISFGATSAANGCTLVKRKLKFDYTGK